MDLYLEKWLHIILIKENIVRLRHTSFLRTFEKINVMEMNILIMTKIIRIL